MEMQFLSQLHPVGERITASRPSGNAAVKRVGHSRRKRGEPFQEQPPVTPAAAKPEEHRLKLLLLKCESGLWRNSQVPEPEPWGSPQPSDLQTPAPLPPC